MSKSKAVMDLLATGHSPSEIVDTVGCCPSYVRTVRQRQGAGRSEADRRYWSSDKGHRSIGRHAPKRNAYANAWNHEMRRSGDRNLARQKGREAAAKVILT